MGYFSWHNLDHEKIISNNLQDQLLTSCSKYLTNLLLYHNLHVSFSKQTSKKQLKFLTKKESVV